MFIALEGVSATSKRNLTVEENEATLILRRLQLLHPVRVREKVRFCRMPCETGSDRTDAVEGESASLRTEDALLLISSIRTRLSGFSGPADMENWIAGAVR